MSKNSGVKFGGAARRHFHANWKKLQAGGWILDIRPTTVCGLTTDCNVRNHKPKCLLVLFINYMIFLLVLSAADVIPHVVNKKFPLMHYVVLNGGAARCRFLDTLQKTGMGEDIFISVQCT